MFDHEDLHRRSRVFQLEAKLFWEHIDDRPSSLGRSGARSRWPRWHNLDSLDFQIKVPGEPCPIQNGSLYESG